MEWQVLEDGVLDIKFLPGSLPVLSGELCDRVAKILDVPMSAFTGPLRALPSGWSRERSVVLFSSC